MRRGRLKSRRRDEGLGNQKDSAPSWINCSVLQVALVTVLAISSYLPSLDGEFVFDDSATVVNNPVVNGRTSLKQVFTTDYWGNPIASPQSHKSYRPLTTFSFWLNYQIHGEWTLPYHVVNLILHALVSILVFVLVRVLRNHPDDRSSSAYFWDEAMVAASAFAVHPVHTEAVANISGRAELLMSVFALSSLIHYIRCQQRRSFNVQNVLVFSLLVALAVFSKEQGISVLPLCIILEITSSSSKKWSTFLRCSALAGYAASLTVLRLRINNFTAPKFTELDNPAAFVADPLLRSASFCYLWLVNIRLLVLPHSLCFDYSMGCIPPIQSWSDPRALAVPAVALLIVYFVHIFFGRNDSLHRLGIFLGIVTFLPASNLLVTVGFTIAERVLYLPSVGICIVAAILFRHVQQRFNNVDKLLLAVLVVGATLSYQRAEEWRTELDLYASGLRVCTQNAKVHYNIGKVLSRIGDVSGAEHNYLNAIRLNPHYDHAMNNLANILEAKGRSEEAEVLLKKALKSRPTFAVAWMNLGITLMNQGKHEEALKSFRRSLQLRPSSSDCLFNLGNLFQKMGRSKDALDAWENATMLDPNHRQALTNLFVALDERDECEKVVALSRQIPETVVEQAAALAFQIGVCLGKIARFPEAELRLKSAIRLNPHSALYHANLGVLYQRWARYDLAESSYRRALLIDSESSSVKWNLHIVREKLNTTRSQSNSLL
ncbi:hypothetical protein Q1695_009396 [Nippostrongylus brasiliensis]|nr:hypothetical protein Q1695_009396 [Nippostrongylus brasiliensis]